MGPKSKKSQNFFFFYKKKLSKQTKSWQNSSRFQHNIACHEMGKLADLVSEDLSFAEKISINLRKVGLAGVGLASIVDSERTRLYRQIMEVGHAYGRSDTIVGRLSTLGTGTVNLVLEESQRVFDELVEEGEQALNRSKPPAVIAPPPRKITQSRPVAKSRAPSPRPLPRRSPT